jgi:hypothetical protein
MERNPYSENNNIEIVTGSIINIFTNVIPFTLLKDK